MDFSYTHLFAGQCPPVEAEESEGVVYRGIKEPPVSDEDFLSHVELGRPNAEDNVCIHRGLSVWRTPAAVWHARKLSRFFKNLHIAVGVLEPQDGMIAPTPSGNQADHFTFWKVENVQITGKFKLTDQFDGGV